MIGEKKYYYQVDENWKGPYRFWFLFFSIPSKNTLTWWPELCPEGYKTPDTCSHDKLPYSELKKRLFEQYWSDWKKSKLTILIILFLIAIAVVIIPYICREDGPPKKDKIETEYSIEYKGLKVKLKTKTETEFYEVKKVPNNEVIKGKKGTYYIIDLRNTLMNERVLFQAGEFIIADLNDEFVNSLNHFMSEVYMVLDTNSSLELFVKGSADISGNNTFRNSIRSYYLDTLGFSSIEYLPQISNQKSLFADTLMTLEITQFYTNSELPNLRGKFLQLKLAQSYAEIPPPEILEGLVDEREGEEFRNACMIMYIDWKK